MRRSITAIVLLVSLVAICQSIGSPPDDRPRAPAPSTPALPSSGFVPPPPAPPGPPSTSDPLVRDRPATGEVNELLDQLEALKAKKEAIERQEQQVRAALEVKLKAQQERIRKLGIGAPTPAAAGREDSSYEPVTTYRTSRVRDPKTGQFKEVQVPVTTYVQRKKTEEATPGVPPVGPDAAPLASEASPSAPPAPPSVPGPG